MVKIFKKYVLHRFLSNALYFLLEARDRLLGGFMTGIGFKN